MKRILGIALLSLLAVGSAYAASESRMSLNALAGLNFEGSSDTPASTTVTKSKGALSYGATIEFAVAPMFALETGVFLNDNKEDNTTVLGTYTASVKSTEIPFLGKYSTPFFEIGAGGYYEMISNTKATVTNSTVVAVPNGTYDLSPNLSSSDYGVKADARGKLPVSPTINVLLDASYKYGLKDVDPTAASSKKTRTYALMAGIGIGF